MKRLLEISFHNAIAQLFPIPNLQDNKISYLKLSSTKVVALICSNFRHSPRDNRPNGDTAISVISYCFYFLSIICNKLHSKVQMKWEKKNQRISMRRNKATPV